MKEIMILVLISLIINSCDNITDTESPETNSYDVTAYNQTVSNAMDTNSGYHEDSGDYTWDSSTEVKITLNETTISVDGSGASVDGSTVTITSAGNYNISGTLSDGQIVIDTEDSDVVRLILNNVNIICSSSAPINIINAEKTILILADNSENYIVDGNTYVFDNAEEDEPNAAIFSKDDLSIFGSGALIIDANYNDGISSKDGLVINSGTITIDAVDDGIRGKDYLAIMDGTITITAAGDGLKSDNDEDETMGYIYIEQGDINITAQTDAIDAQTDVLICDGQFNLKSGGGSSRTVSSISSAKGVKGNVSVLIDDGNITANSADDALHSNTSIVVNGGEINISTGDDGIHADKSVIINNGTIIITKSVEGVEGNYITVNGGKISVVSSDDCFNSTAGSRTERNDKSCTYIYGGYIVLNSSSGDGLDSNGSIVMNDGTVIIHGPSNQPEVMIDYNGTFNISGGLLVSSGSSSNMTQAPSSSSSQNSLKIMFRSAYSASTIFHIEDSNGDEVVTFQPLHRYQSVVFSSSDLVKGKTYNIYLGGSTTGENNDGIYSGGTYSGGTKSTTFTVAGTITSINI